MQWYTLSREGGCLKVKSAHNLPIAPADAKGFCSKTFWGPYAREMIPMWRGKTGTLNGRAEAETAVEESESPAPTATTITHANGTRITTVTA